MSSGKDTRVLTCLRGSTRVSSETAALTAIVRTGAQATPETARLPGLLEYLPMIQYIPSVVQARSLAFGGVLTVLFL